MISKENLKQLKESLIKQKNNLSITIDKLQKKVLKFERINRRSKIITKFLSSTIVMFLPKTIIDISSKEIKSIWDFLNTFFEFNSIFKNLFILLLISISNLIISISNEIIKTKIENNNKNIIELIKQSNKIEEQIKLIDLNLDNSKTNSINITIKINN